MSWNIARQKGEFVAVWGLTWGIPLDLEQECNHLKKLQSASQKKGDITVQVHIDKRLVQIISTIYEAQWWTQDGKTKKQTWK
jgi:hypothetical protein